MPASNGLDAVIEDFDNDDICSDPFEEGCTESLADGEGWDGACGNCADRVYAKENHDDDDDGGDDDGDEHDEPGED